MSDDKTPDDYEVGYGKPPKNTQFRKGVSGNPRGRPKKAPDFDHVLIREANSVMTVTTSSSSNMAAGEPFTITGATFNGPSLNVSGVVCTTGTSTCSAPTATTFTFVSSAAASASGTGGQVNKPAQINFRAQ